MQNEKSPCWTVEHLVMYGKVVAALICLFCVVSCAPQDDEEFNFSRRRSTTLDPVKAFFNSPIECLDGKGVCIKECLDVSLVTLDLSCGSQLICCRKESDHGIAFPTRIPTRPPATKPPAMTTPRIRATRPTTTTTTTTTTEEPEDLDFNPRDCGYGSTDGDDDSSGLPIADSFRGEFPWNVGIFSRETNAFGYSQDVFHCGGTIIDDFVVLTAASCVFNKKRSSLIVIAGVLNFALGKKGRQERELDKIVVHPKFAHTSFVYDIAFLYLSDKFDYSRTINRICLPRPGVNLKESDCLFTGWGEPLSKDKVRTTLKTVRVELVESKLCEKSLRRYLGMTRFQLSKSIQCAQEEAEINLGIMDLGSPLICEIPGRTKQFYQVGIFSRSEFATGYPSRYTNVTLFREWIDDQMAAVDLNTYSYQPSELDEENT